MSQDTNVTNLIINKLTKQQYEGIADPSDTELYMVTDDIGITSSDVTAALGYTPENTANKVTALSPSSTDVQYPSAKCVYDFMAEKGISRNIGEIVASALPLTDAGLHLLDGTLILGGGVYDEFVTYMGSLYDEARLFPNVQLHGDLASDDNILSGFSTVDYATLGANFNPGGTPWEMQFKFTTGDDVSTQQYVFNAYNCVNLTINLSGYLTVALGTGSTSSTTWDILATTTLVAAVANTEYIVKFVFDVTKYEVYLDGVLATSATTTTAIGSNPGNIGINNGSTRPWKGSIDLNNSYIKLDGEYWWKGTAPAWATNEATWQQMVMDYGVCSKFVYTPASGNVAAKVRLPRISGILEGTTDPEALTRLVEAGLPNITGAVSYFRPNTRINAASSATGAFSSSSADAATYSTLGTSTAASTQVDFDASRSNFIYGKSNTVQPQAIKVLYYIIIATAPKTQIQVDIDNITTELNSLESNKLDKSAITYNPATQTLYIGASE